MEGQVVLALCGFGRAGQFHFKGIRLNNRCRLKYVVEVEVEKAEKIILSSNISNVVVINGKDFHVALADPEVQAVIVATPTFTHEGYVTQALQAGKAVLCEKPIAEDIEKVAFCYSEAERAGKPLICAFNRRFDPSMARIQTKVANGDIGKVHILKTTSRDYPPPTLDYLKISGGMFQDTGIHDLDMVCWMIGEEPTTVHTMAHAHQQAVGDIPDVDTLVITMKFPSGVIAIIDISRHSTYGYDQRIEVFGSAGMLQCSNPATDNGLIMKESAMSTSPAPDSCVERYQQSYMLELNHFVDVVLDPKKTLTVTKRDTLRATQLAEACQLSYSTGQVVPFKYKEY